MATIDQDAEKWERKAAAGIRRLYARNLNYDRFVSGVSAYTGLSESTVRDTLPAENYREFVDGVDDAFVEAMIDKLDGDEWKGGYLQAFGG